MFNENGYSLSDLAVATGNRDGFGMGNNGSWWIIVLFLFVFMGGNFGNNYNNLAAYTRPPVTSEDLQNQFNFAALERQNNEIMANSRQVAYDISTDIRDVGYNDNNIVRDVGAALNENIRDIQGLVQLVGSEQAQGFCNTNRNIDSVKYDNAINTKDIMRNDSENTQKILDAIAHNKMSDMQNQINQLQLQAALCGVVRYPSATTYTAGYSPYFNGGFYNNGAGFYG